MIKSFHVFFFFFALLSITSTLKKLLTSDIFLLIFRIIESIFNWYLRKLFCLVYSLSTNMVIRVYEYERSINLTSMHKKEKKNAATRNVFHTTKTTV